MEAVFTARQMRQADALTIERLNGNGLLLMEHASGACVRELWKLTGGRLPEMTVLVLAGCGNNGGDGLAIARQLASRGVKVSAILLGTPERMSGDAVFQFEVLKNYPVPVRIVSEHLTPETELMIRSADLLVDAMLGTGLNQAPRGIIAEVIRILNAFDSRILSVDVPSGLNSDSGAIRGEAVRADLTVTFGKRKRCHVLSPSCFYCGKIVVDDITIPEDIFETVEPDCFLITKEDIQSRFPRIEPDSHKGTFGHVLVAGGIPGRLGASVMAGRAALGSGSGLVTVYLHRDLYPIAGPMAPELMMSLFEDPFSLSEIRNALTGKDAMLLGPGFGTSDAAKKAMEKLISVSTVPIVLDADVFRLFSSDELAEKLSGRPVILTPHPGEAASFLGISSSEIQEDRVGFAVQIARKTGAVTVLKGFHTVIGTPDGKAYVNPTGNAGLATAGSGDVLAGMALSFLGQGMSPLDAAICSVYLHGLSGDIASDTLSVRGVTAPKILDTIPLSLKSVMEYPQ